MHNIFQPVEHESKATRFIVSLSHPINTSELEEKLSLFFTALANTIQFQALLHSNRHRGSKMLRLIEPWHLRKLRLIRPQPHDLSISTRLPNRTKLIIIKAAAYSDTHRARCIILRSEVRRGVGWCAAREDERDFSDACVGSADYVRYWVS
jgi:hypothetical protein